MHRTRINVGVNLITALPATVAGVEASCGKERSLNLTIHREWYEAPNEVENVRGVETAKSQGRYYNRLFFKSTFLSGVKNFLCRQMSLAVLDVCSARGERKI